MTRQNEFDAMLEIVRKRYGGDLKEYLMAQTPEDMQNLLRSHLSREALVGIILAAYAALVAMDGREEPKGKRRNRRK